MKIDDAIRKVESIFSDSPNIVSDEDNESVEFALEAMEKQYPMRPLSSHGEYICPRCEITVAWVDRYCWYCGQKLDWEE